MKLNFQLCIQFSKFERSVYSFSSRKWDLPWAAILYYVLYSTLRSILYLVFSIFWGDRDVFRFIFLIFPHRKFMDIKIQSLFALFFIKGGKKRGTICVFNLRRMFVIRKDTQRRRRRPKKTNMRPCVFLFSICLLAAADAGLFMRCNIICNVYRRQRKTTAAIELDIIYKHFQLMPIFLFFLFFVFVLWFAI